MTLHQTNTQGRRRKQHHPKGRGGGRKQLPPKKKKRSPAAPTTLLQKILNVVIFQICCILQLLIFHLLHLETTHFPLSVHLKKVRGLCSAHRPKCQPRCGLQWILPCARRSQKMRCEEVEDECNHAKMAASETWS